MTDLELVLTMLAEVTTDDTVKIEALDGTSALPTGVADITNTGEQNFSMGVTLS